MLTFTTKTTPASAPWTTLTLPWDLRLKSRIKVTLDNGVEAGIILPRGTVLRGGDVLQAEDTIIAVIAAPELISIVRCEDPLLFARICYHLGNRHVPLQIDQGEARYQHDHVLDDMVKGLGAEVFSDSLPFEPEHGAYGSHAEHGHHHAH
ncbi:urease accessory protein UreE [Desulfogranum japonicum]|uniref:urease accessory protein UreE n=1 Tax=Desulfogranum japonicum TaxID=231447 RepID=UPI000405EAEB|nr:urease accessory protein UreE [Desulfogranum japonicum]